MIAIPTWAYSVVKIILSLRENAPMENWAAAAVPAANVSSAIQLRTVQKAPPFVTVSIAPPEPVKLVSVEVAFHVCVWMGA